MTCTECHPDQETTNTPPVVSYFISERAEPTKPKDNTGLYVPRKEYFDHENWGNS